MRFRVDADKLRPGNASVTFMDVDVGLSVAFPNFDAAPNETVQVFDEDVLFVEQVCYQGLVFHDCKDNLFL